MSEETVEIVRRAIDTFNRGDFEAALEYYAPDAVWDWSNSRGFNPGVFRGHIAIRGAWRQFTDSFDEVRIELEDLVEVQDGLVITQNVGRIRGRDGIEVQARSAWLIRVVDGEIAALTMYQTRDEARKAAGLSE
jgi:ketosteroid isomerase-like protein